MEWRVYRIPKIVGPDTFRPGQFRKKKNLLIKLCDARLPRSAPLAHLISQHDLRQPILIFRIGVLQIRVGLLEFRLAEFHN